MNEFMSIHGWLTRREGAELARLAALNLPGEIVEIGTFLGRSTAFLASAAPKLIHVVDHFLGSPEMQPGGNNPQGFIDGKRSFYDQFLGNMQRLGLDKKIIAHIGDSADVAGCWGATIKLLFIDADHSYEGVARDWNAWYPYVLPDGEDERGGHVCFHDYCAAWPGVVKFVDERIAEGRFTECHKVDDLMVCRIK